MKKVNKLVFLLVLFIASVAQGMEWRFVKQSNGLFYRVNELGENDGWYHEYRYYNKCWNYYKHSKITVVEELKAELNTNIDISQTWKEDLVQQLGRVKVLETKLLEGQQFIQALKESGLTVSPAILAAYGISATTYPMVGIAESGISVLSQGQHGQGNTVYSATSIKQIPIDWQMYMQYKQNYADRSFDALQAGDEGFNQNIKLFKESELELEKFKVGVQGITNVAVASVTPKTLTNEWRRGPVGAVKTSETTVVASSGNRGGGISALALTKGQVFMNNTCVKCHNPKELKSNLDLTNTGGFSPEDRAYVAGESLKRMLSDDPEYKMPPPSTGVEVTTDDAVNVNAAIKAGTFNER